MAKVKRRTVNKRQNGRDAQGRFAKGNPGGPGNPHVARVQAFRKAALDAMTPAGVRKAVRLLEREVDNGNVAAAREYLDRTIGRSPLFADLELSDRVAAIEESLRKDGVLCGMKR